jgi:hypothetical protein
LDFKDKDAQKLKWLEKCIEQLQDDKWIIISIKHIKEILQQYQEVCNDQADYWHRADHTHSKQIKFSVLEARTEQFSNKSNFQSEQFEWHADCLSTRNDQQAAKRVFTHKHDIG